MKRILAVLIALVPLVYTSAAWAVPGWCKGTGGNKVDVSGGLDHALKGDELLWSVHDLVGAMCFPDGDARAKMKELEAQHAAWSKKLELNDSDWSDVAAWAAAPQAERSSTTMMLEGKKPWSTLDALDHYVLLNNDIGENYDPNYMADAMGARFSEAGRLAYILQCARSNTKEVQWAICQPDINAFDFKKLVAELRADKTHDGFQRFMIRKAGYELPEHLKEHNERVKKAKASDPAYAKMFELAEGARKPWDAFWKTDAKLLELVAEMDDARITKSRKATSACADKTWAAWKAAVGAIPAKKWAGIQTDEIWSTWAERLFAPIANDPRAYLAGAALFVCEAANRENPDPMVRTIGRIYERWPGFRGPRNAAFTAILTAGLELDERGAKIDFPDAYRRWFSAGGSSSGGGSGVVSAIKAQGDKLRVEFAAKMEKQWQCAQTKRTNRIVQIRGDGGLVYETICLKETTVTVNRASQPQTIAKRYDTLKAGMNVVIIEDAVIAAWPKAGVSIPSIIGGVPVK